MLLFLLSMVVAVVVGSCVTRCLRSLEAILEKSMILERKKTKQVRKKREKERGLCVKEEVVLVIKGRAWISLVKHDLDGVECDTWKMSWTMYKVSIANHDACACDTTRW